MNFFIGASLGLLQIDSDGEIYLLPHVRKTKCMTSDEGVMSAFGTYQTSISTLNMSAFGGKADIPDRLADVR